MARPVLFVVVALAFVVVTTYLLAKYVYPQYLEYRRDVAVAEMELEKRRLERDEKLVEAAEEDLGATPDSGADGEHADGSGTTRPAGDPDADSVEQATGDDATTDRDMAGFEDADPGSTDDG